MQELLLILPAVFLVYTIGVTLKAFAQARSAGVQGTDELMRVGFSLNRMRRGDLAEPDSGSLVTVREGMTMSRNSDGSRRIIGTRTISRDLY
jgi:hypothetical protein